jgi:hypothetical protein
VCGQRSDCLLVGFGLLVLGVELVHQLEFCQPLTLSQINHPAVVSYLLHQLGMVEPPSSLLTSDSHRRGYYQRCVA